MTQSEETKKKRLQEAAMNVGGTGAIIPVGDSEKGDSVITKDPNVELTKIQLQMALAVPPYEGVLLQVTPFDHPIQPTSISNDLTMLEWMRMLGMPTELYKVIKGQSYLDEKGSPHIAMSGFGGFLRARNGLLYPGVEGMEFHPREQIMSGTKREKQEKKDKKWYQRLLGIGGE